MEEDGRLPGGRSDSVSAVLEDGRERFVRTGVEQKSTGAGGVDALMAIALDQPENADGGAEACSGCGRDRKMTSIRVSASGPTLAASERIRSWVQSR